MFGHFNSMIALENNSGSGCDALSTCNASYSIVQATKAKGKPYGLTISYVLIQSRNVNLSDFFLARFDAIFRPGQGSEQTKLKTQKKRIVSDH